ncbi:MAG TPA: hypothetical protein P5081_19075 [Phycisphaerae bacterium]|nr:hypothetical protein [Phycisphaerae bacterium]HRW54977.1 hypothetical protein [Phycisphaerae bacterium]
MSKEAKLRALLEKEPNDGFLNFGLAMELAKQERWDESFAQFDRLIAVDPDYVGAYFHKGKTLASVGRTDDARVELRRGIEKAGEVGDFHARGEMEEYLAGL